MTSTLVRARDGQVLAATLYQAARPNGIAVLVNSGTGIPRQFYAPLASHLAELGFCVMTYDYRGVGDSTTVGEASVESWGRLDQAAMLDRVVAEWPGQRVAIVAHSLGGQILGLANNIGVVRAAVLLASQSGHWRHWRGWRRWQMFALWWLMIPVLTAAGGRFPGRWFGLVDLPSGVARSWARWGRSPHYVVDGDGRPLRPYNLELRCPIRWLSFSDDPVAPRAAVDALMAYYPVARIERTHLVPAQLGLANIGHFGFFRRSMPPAAWNELAEWLRTQVHA